MYNREDYDSLSRLLKQFYVRWALFGLLPLARVVLACVFRVAAIGYVGAVLLGAVICVGWFAVGQRVFVYRRLVADILNLPQRKAEGLVIAISPEAVTRQGTQLTAIRLQFEDPERANPVERNVYFDAMKGQPPFAVGQYVQVTLFDNIVKQVDKVTDPA